MARNNFEVVRNAGFDATVHFSSKAIADLIRHGMLQGFIPTTFSQNTENVTLAPPIILAESVQGSPVPIPEDIFIKDENGDFIKDENGNKVRLQDPAYPEDRQQQNLLLKINMNVVIN
ncbi:MAG: hypothetical protein NTY07_19665 [Bacteroidia bacterium]|nr:hypothetical protein [Bacteroidia bacterium]